jgi:hypothetical protein
VSLDKRAVYKVFRASLPAEIQNDLYFSVFYSDIRPSRVAITGLDPGGDPDEPATVSCVSKYYKADEHEYVDNSYRLATRMRQLLLSSGIVGNVEEIRAIPKFNVIFHRSRSWEPDAFDQSTARDLARCAVAQILVEIAPRIILIEGYQALTQFTKQQSLTVQNQRTLISSRLKVATIDLNGARTKLVVLAHPTGYRWSGTDWDRAIEQIRTEVSTPAA